jgi:PrsW family intramembrane metalloprotease
VIVAIIFASVWGVVQLIVLGSLARTVRARTVLSAFLVGLYACAPLALLLQIGWIQPAASLTGMSFRDLVGVGGHSVDPFIEELVKVLPVVLLLLTVPAIRRHWSMTDCVLVAAAAGAGFGLAKDLYRYGSSARAAVAEPQGWTLATGLAFPFVPSFWTTLSSWLPPGAAEGDYFNPGLRGHPWVNLHLAWSAIGGLAVGLICVRQGRVAVTAGALLLLYAGADHAASNAGFARDGFAGALRAVPFGAVREWLGLMPIAALAFAWWLDRRRQRAGDSLELLLAAEQSASVRPLGTLRTAVSRVPWSLRWVSDFVQMRRAYTSDSVDTH